MKKRIYFNIFVLLAYSGVISAQDSITVTQALTIGSSLSSYQSTIETYNIVGYVSALAGNTTDYSNYGNQTYWITDDPSSTAASNADGAFEVYRGASDKEVKLGDKVCVSTKIYNYSNGLIESTSYSNVVILPFVLTGLAGENSTWTYDSESQTLSFDGAGEIKNTLSKKYSSYIVNVMISDSITSIGREAFSNYTGLTSVMIGNSVTSIGNNAFQNCKCLTSVIIPDNVTNIESWSFSGCSGLTSITIPNSVTSIGYRAFWGCSLTSVHISDLAAWCRIIFSYEESNPLYYAHHLFLNDIEIIDLIIPNSVTNIGSYAFCECTGLTSATIGNSVTSIGERAFYGCSNLTSVTIPNSVTNIGIGTFQDCSNLTHIMCLGDTPAAIAIGAFHTYSNCNIYVPCGTIDEYKNAWSTYESIIRYFSYEIIANVNIADAGIVEIPQSMCDSIITAIPNYGYHFVRWSDGNMDNPRIIELTQDTTFTAEFALDVSGVCGDNNQLTWTFDSISGTLAISGNGALNCNYTYGLQAPTKTKRLIIEEGVTSVGSIAFDGMYSSISSLALPNSLTTIEDSAFIGLNNRKFNTLILPNTIVSIGAHAFEGASYLKTIHFGSVLEEIGDYAFNGCSRVQEMTCLAEITPNVGTNGLTSINSLAKLYIPNDYLFEYQIDPNWSRFVLSPIGAKETNITTDDVTVTTDDNTATLTWPTNNAADTYTIEITKDGVVFCTLIFNSNGQLTGIAFAPSRSGQPHALAATMTANGMQFTVTGLNSGTCYAFSLVTKSGNTVLASYTGEFETTGATAITTSIDNIDYTKPAQKLLRNGQILIRCGDKTYTLTGQEVK